MSIFGSKKRSLDDIIKDIQTLSDEDRARLNAALTPAESVEPAAPGAEDPQTADDDNAPENEADTPKAAEEPNSESNPADDSAAAEQPAVGEEEPVTNENPAQVSVDYDALIKAMQARIDEMSGLVAELTERCNTLTEKLDSGSFGNHAPGMPSGDIDEEGEMTPTMRSYMSKQTYRGSAK